MSTNRSIQLSGSLLLTFRELWATYVVLGLFAVATLGWLMLAFAMNLDVVEGSIAALRIFGIETLPTEALRDPETGDLVRDALSVDKWIIGIQEFIFGAAYFLGTLLGIFATAPLTTATLQDTRIGLLLSKPVGRTRLLAGHVLGIWLTVAILAAYLIVAIWLVLAIKTGIWANVFLWGIPIICAMFAVMYSIVLLVAVLTRSSGAALVTAYGLIFVSMILAAKSQIVPVMGDIGQAIFMTLYHVLPNFIEVVPIMAQLAKDGSVDTWYPLLSSGLFGLAAYGFATLWFTRRDF